MKQIVQSIKEKRVFAYKAINKAIINRFINYPSLKGIRSASNFSNAQFITKMQCQVDDQTMFRNARSTRSFDHLK